MGHDYIHSTHHVSIPSFTHSECDEDEFHCPNDLPGRCFPLAYLCDDIVDCDDEFDEQNCSKSENELDVHACIFFGSLEWAALRLKTYVPL